MAALTLAIDTAAADCSAALLDGTTVVAAVREAVGRGHAERLVPMVATLLRDSGVERPAAVLVDCGPGSFTGVRVGLAAAIGLGLGWGVAVRGYSATTVLAAAAFARDSSLTACTVAMAGGHGELFVEGFAAPLASCRPLVSLTPDAAAMRADDVVVGSGAAALVAARGGGGTAIDALPDAADAALLPPAALLPARPIYGRPPDARPLAA